MFCAPGLVFSGIEGVGSRFLFLRCRTRFRPYHGCRVQFSCFALADSFLAVTRVSGPVFMFFRSGTRFQRYRGRQDPFFMFWARGRIFNSTEGAGSRFQVLRFQAHCRRYRGTRISFPCFAFPNTFLAVPRSSGPVFMFCSP
jgi:hypothetical protein